MPHPLHIVDIDMLTDPLVIGGGIFAIMGLVHGVLSLADVFRPRQFTPVDDAVRLAMQSTTVRFLRARANLWDAWLGFNISHSLGMLVFGCAVLLPGMQLDRAAFVAPAATAIGLIYVALSLRFWFYAPAIASIAAAGCFALAWWKQ